VGLSKKIHYFILQTNQKYSPKFLKIIRESEVDLNGIGYIMVILMNRYIKTKYMQNL
jgi:hypothetical protein